MVEHQDLWALVDQDTPLAQRLAAVHQIVKQQFAFIDRIAVVVYDPQTDLLKTFAHSSGGDDPLSNYADRLANVPSLHQIMDCRQPRVINDMDVFAKGTHEHTLRLRAQGYGASYTIPIFIGGGLAGFVFFDSYQKNVFSEAVLRQLDLVGHVISLMSIQQLTRTETLQALFKGAADSLHARDFEPGTHLQRVANYARLIASELAPQYHLSDEYIEDIFRFAPMHDVGKLAIPERLLMKPAQLTAAERQEMQMHTTRGAAIIDDMLQSYGLQDLPHADMLRNIALYHHERLNGGGYPEGLKGGAIPLEARIVAVADVFDALTYPRVYKTAQGFTPFSTADAIAILERYAGEEFDRDCVAALVRRMPEVEATLAHFQEGKPEPATASPGRLWRLHQLDVFMINTVDGSSGYLDSVDVKMPGWRVQDLVVGVGEQQPRIQVRMTLPLVSGIDHLGIIHTSLKNDEIVQLPAAVADQSPATAEQINSRALNGCRIQASDGEDGQVTDLLINDAKWAVQYLVIQMHRRWPGKKILLPTRLIVRYDGQQKQVVVNLPKKLIQQAPVYHPALLIDPVYEAALAAYYSGQAVGKVRQTAPAIEYW